MGERNRTSNNITNSSKTITNSTRIPKNWNIEPSVGRVVNGVPKRVDRLKGLGNAIVPQVAMYIMQRIKKVGKIE